MGTLTPTRTTNRALIQQHSPQILQFAPESDTSPQQSKKPQKSKAIPNSKQGGCEPGPGNAGSEAAATPRSGSGGEATASTRGLVGELDLLGSGTDLGARGGRPVEPRLILFFIFRLAARVESSPCCSFAYPVFFLLEATEPEPATALRTRGETRTRRRSDATVTRWVASAPGGAYL